MIDYFQNNQPAFWFSLGFLLLIVEVLVFGFTSGMLLFAGLGGIVAGGMMWLGIIPPTWFAGFVTFGLSSSIVAALLWKPLLSMQNDGVPEKDNSSDIIGYQFRLQEPVTHLVAGKTHYSGIDWRVEIDHKATVSEIEAGALVEVSSVDAGLFRVVPAATE